MVFKEGVAGPLVNGSASRDRVVEVALALRLQYGGGIQHIYEAALQGYAATGLEEWQALLLADDPRVARVEENCVLVPSEVQSNPPWHLDRIEERFLPMDGKYVYKASGWATNAYVLDFLIQKTHDEFEGRVLSRVDCVGNDENSDPSTWSCTPILDDDQAPPIGDSHGTSVASVLGGKTVGVAKAVKLHSVRVCGAFDSATKTLVCEAADVIAGVNWVKNNHVKPSVANVSLNYASPSFLEAFGVKDAIEAAIAAGVTFTISAGNQNDDACNYPPANAPSAIRVGGTDSEDRRWVASSTTGSNYGVCVDLFAGAKDVLAAFAGSPPLFEFTGTSFAAPAVAGLAAMYLTRKKDENPTPSDVKSFILSWATSGVVIDPGPGSSNLLLFSPYSDHAQ